MWKLYSRCLEEIFREKFCIKKIFFCRTLSDLERKIFALSAKLFSARLSSFHSTFAEESLREKFLEKKTFLLFPDLEQKIDYWKNVRLKMKILFYVSGGIFFGKTYFLKLFDIFFLVFRAKNCNLWKEFLQNCENSILQFYRNVLMKLIWLTKDLFS